MFQGCFKGVSRVFHGCFKGVSWVFKECFKGILRVFQGKGQAKDRIIIANPEKNKWSEFNRLD